MTIRISLFAVLLAACSCSSGRIAARKSYVTDRWSILQDPQTDQYVVIAKGNVDLKEALAKMGCTGQPCGIDRLGDVYTVTPLASPKKAQPAKPAHIRPGKK